MIALKNILGVALAAGALALAPLARADEKPSGHTPDAGAAAAPAAKPPTSPDRDRPPPERAARPPGPTRAAKPQQSPPAGKEKPCEETKPCAIE